MNERIHLLDVFFFEPAERIEVLNLGRNLGGKLSGVESGNRRDAATSFAEAFPCFFGSRAQRGYQSYAGNNNCSLLQITTSYLRFRKMVLNVFDSVLHGSDFLCLFVRDLQSESFFQR